MPMPAMIRTTQTHVNSFRMVVDYKWVLGRMGDEKWEKRRWGDARWVKDHSIMDQCAVRKGGKRGIHSSQLTLNERAPASTSYKRSELRESAGARSLSVCGVE